MTSRRKNIVKSTQKAPIVDFNPSDTRAWNKESHLHYHFKPTPDPKGNRAERRAAKKRRGSDDSRRNSTRTD